MNLSIAIPTYQRSAVLLETVAYLKSLVPQPSEILVIDQTNQHEPQIAQALAELQKKQIIR